MKFGLVKACKGESEYKGLFKLKRLQFFSEKILPNFQ